MALNFQQILDKVRQIGQGAQEREQRLETLRHQVLSLLVQWAGRTEELNARLERARRVDTSLRCAIPLGERLDAHLPAGDISDSSMTLIAADGSQVIPDRHAPVLYGLINVGVIVIPSGSGSPIVLTDSQLSFDDEVLTWTESLVALRRDLAERKKLLEVSGDYPLPVVTLTDGPLQLWESRESDEVMGYEKALTEYLDVLSQLQRRGVLTAGYVDKPASNLLVRLLEVALTPESELDRLHDLHPLQGVSDLWLFDHILLPGERSAVFGLQARSRAVYQGPLALHFFYLNAGLAGHPKTVRVEIPAWVASDPAQINLLQRCLLDQCAILGARPYPYILHRAHESAVVSLQEKQQIDQMLAIELRRSGGEVGEQSGKQASKDASNAGRKRYV